MKVKYLGLTTFSSNEEDGELYPSKVYKVDSLMNESVQNINEKIMHSHIIVR